MRSPAAIGSVLKSPTDAAARPLEKGRGVIGHCVGALRWQLGAISWETTHDRRGLATSRQRPGRETGDTQTQQNWIDAGYFFFDGAMVTLLSVGMPDFFNIDWTFFAVAAGLGFLAILMVPAVG